MSDVLDKPEVSQEFEEEKQNLAVVGVGVCALSLRSLETLFANVDSALDAAFIVAVRQQEGLDVATVVEALHRHSSLTATIGEDGRRLEPNHIYVGGPDDMITLEDGHLRVRSASEPVGHRGTIDTMLMSIAEHAHEQSVAVLLDGLGSDGTAGVTATKKFGGLSIAEAAAADDINGAAGFAGPTGVVDLHVSADRIATEIAHYLGNIRKGEQSPIPDQEHEQTEAQVTQITTILRNMIGHDFHGYKRGTFLRRVRRRLQVLQINDIDAYIDRLRSDREEVQNLFQDLLIGVTQFFRDPQEFEVLERELPRLFEGKGPDDQFRVWVLGCATGEEAYSLAILLREHMATLDHPPHVQIFATDLDARALGLARAGRYAESIAEHVRPDRLERWFVREGNTFCVAKELREMCIFSPHNLIKDAPFSRIDILSCRNLLIYLNTELQDRVMPIFHFSLRPGGVLFLGSSENVTRHQKLFAPIDRKRRVFRRLETATRIVPDFPLSTRGSTPLQFDYAVAEAARPARLPSSASRQAEAVAERYAPAYVLVDSQLDVVHFSGRTGRFLEPLAGTATLNLPNLVHRDLRSDLRSALHRALTEKRRIELPRLVLHQEDRAVGVNLIVEPIGGSDVISLVVVFQDTGPVFEGKDGDRLNSDEHVQQLEAELRVTRDRLQATIEELETTNEELKSSNEEYQSINEELQSANEEMETSKEELQSVNEELQTVNGELAHRVAELSRSNSDLKNLLEATQIATVFLDNDLRIRSFTPSATEIFHLLETDVGRPLGHVVSRVAYPEIQDDVRRVLKTLVPVERQVGGTGAGRHFSVRILPYRSTDNYINGAVVTFTDFTEVYKAQEALRESEERHRLILESARDYAIFTTDEEGRIREWPPGAEAVFGWKPGEIVGQDLAITFLPEDRAAGAPEQERQEARDKGHSPNVRWHLRKDGSRVFIEGVTRRLPAGSTTATGFLKIGKDVTERRVWEEQQKVLLAELQHRTRNLMGVVRSVGEQTLRSSTELADFAPKFRGRLEALTRVNNLLSRLHEGDRISFDQLIHGEIDALGKVAHEEGRVVLAGPKGVMLRSSTVQILAMALHELATNAVKYGALKQQNSVPQGRLAVTWTFIWNEGKPQLLVDWRESGVTMPADSIPALGSGAGRQLIEHALPYQLDARTTFLMEGDGVHCTITLPVSEKTALREGADA